MKTMLIGAAVGTAVGAAAVLSCPCFHPVLKRMFYKKKKQMICAMRKMCI